MKVCIASVNFLETTFPLAKYLSDKNHQVTVFCILPMINRDRGNVIDYSKHNVKYGLDDRFNDIVFNQKLKQYLEKVTIHSFFYSNIKKSPIFNFILAFRIVRLILGNNFDVIHLIGSSPFLYLIHILIGKKDIVHSLHEVTAHEENIPMPVHQKILLNLLCRRNVKLILHSSIARIRFINYYSEFRGKKYPVENRIFFIPFSTFETFRCFESDELISEEEATLLFFGRIVPYKGLNYLIEAVNILKNKFPLIKLIIAGYGKLESDSATGTNFEILNRFIGNDELIKLIKRAKIVICPYISASQSGIPMVAFLYDKPVIATDVGGLPEIIEHLKTGIIVPPRDSIALSKAIEKILTEPAFLKSLKYNISTKYMNSNNSWQDITEKTVAVYSA